MKNTDIATLYKDIHKKLGIRLNPSTEYEAAIKMVVDIIIYPDKYKQGEQVTVVPLETGGGKSSITNMTLSWLAKTDYTNSGTIILKERIEDCNRTAEDINKLTGKTVAVAYHSKIFNNRSLRKKYLLKQDMMKNLFNYPILVMTHEGFKTKMARLSEFIYWSEDELPLDIAKVNKKLLRSRLIVDEQPTLMDTFQIKPTHLNEIESYIQKQSNKHLMEQISYVCNYIRSNCFCKRANLESQYWDCCNFTFSKAFDVEMCGCRNEPIKDIYYAMKIFNEEGGFVNYNDNDVFKTITVARYIDIFDVLFNAIILDGTGRINAVYHNNYFNIVDIPQIKTYSNTTICVCKQLNGSRNELRTNKKILDTASQYVLKVVPEDEQCLIVTHKEFEDYLDALDLPSNIYVDHYGNITGSNYYRNFKYGFYIGLPFLYDNAYKLAFHLYNKDKNYNRTHKTVTIKGVRKMVDEGYNKTMVSMLTVELVQAINRLRCRNWNGGDTLETFSFILNRDPEVIELIQRIMPGVNIIYDDVFYSMLPQKVKKKHPVESIDILVQRLLDYHINRAGSAISKKDLIEADERLSKFKNKARAALWSHPQIQQLVDDGIIQVKNKAVEFL